MRKKIKMVCENFMETQKVHEIESFSFTLVKKCKLINNMLENRPDLTNKWKVDLDEGMEADEEL